jgi:NADH dehydrogenase FAD-containing subunit
VKKTLLLIGGGHAHVEVLRQLAAKPPTDADVALFNPSPSVWCGAMLPGVIAGHYEPAEAKVNLWALCQRARVRFFETSVLALSAENGVLDSGVGERHRFDAVSLDIGCVSKPIPTIPGAYVVTLQPIDPFLAAIREFESVRSAGLMVRVVGEGAAALETALALAYRWRDSSNRRIALVAATPLLQGYPARVRSLALKACKKLGIELRENTQVAQIEPTRLRLANGETIDTQLTVLAHGTTPAPLLQRSDVKRTADGTVEINACMQSTQHPHIFAAGDCATSPGLPLPRAGALGISQGPALAASLLAYLAGSQLLPQRAATAAMNIISLGDKRAIATRSGLAIASAWAWRWKDAHDRKWIERYAHD